MKRILVFLLVMFMVVAAFSGCSGLNTQQTGTSQSSTTGTEQKEETQTPGEALLNTEGELPITKEKVNLSMAIPAQPYDVEDFNQMWFFKNYEELTNVHWTFNKILISEYNEKKNIMMAAGEYPDVIWCRGTARFSPTEINRYGSEGIFLNLKDYLKYTPDFVTAMDLVEDSWDYVTNSKGEIFSFAYVNPVVWYNGTFISINGELLNKAGIIKTTSGLDNMYNFEERPSTVDEFYQALVAIKELDSKIIPLSAVWNNTSIPLVWLAAFGYDTNASYKYIGFDTLNNDKLVFIPMETRYKEMLEYLRKLYKEGLLDKDSFTQDSNQLNAKGNQQTLAAFYNGGRPETIDQINYDKYLQLLLSYNDSAKAISPASSQLVKEGSVMITDKCKYPVVAASWINLFYQVEHNFNIMYGPEQWDYQLGTDKEIKGLHSPVINSNPDGTYKSVAPTSLMKELGITSAWEFYAYDHPINGIYATTIGEEYTFIQKFPGKPETVEKMRDVFLDRIKNLTFEDTMRKEGVFRYQASVLSYGNEAYGLPTIYFNADQQEWMNQYATILSDYINTMEVKFITGASDIDKDYPAFISQLKALGAEEYYKIHQDAYKK